MKTMMIQKPMAKKQKKDAVDWELVGGITRSLKNAAEGKIKEWKD